MGDICPRCLVASATAPADDADPAGEMEADTEAHDNPPVGRPPILELGIGSKVGDYELMDVLGRGGMAVVYLARQVSLDRLVALKTMSASISQNAVSQERFRREARAVAGLDHPGIVSVHDAGEMQGALYYTMDFVDGPDLGRVLRERRLPALESATLVRQVAEAVGHAHTHGVVHRDLKPANVLVDAGGQPRVADFGLVFESEAAGSLTLTGDVFGTPPYMAPEMLSRGVAHAVPASDVYSLGAMLFQMLTGRTPFIGDSPSQILRLALSEQPPSVRLLNPTVPRDLEIICLKCLEKSPAERYANGTELGDDLQRFLDASPILGQPASARVRLLRWSRRRPALAMLIAALALGTVGATWSALAINAGRQRALLAESKASEGLWRANLSHAQAARRTTQAGARREALGAIADAARFRPSLALRNEAIAALCLNDVEVTRSWQPPTSAGGKLAFDPALESYLTETAPGKLSRRSCADDRELGRLEAANTGAVAGVPVFSPDGRYVAVRTADAVVRVWETAAARVVCELPGHPVPLLPEVSSFAFDLAFRPDSGQLAVGGAHNGFTLYAIPGGQEQGGWASDNRPVILRFSPDGARVAVVGKQEKRVRFINARTLAEERAVPLPSIPICAAWNPGGDSLALGTRKGRIHFVNPASGEITDTITAYENGGVGLLAFHPRQPILIGNGSDEAIRFWDTSSSQMFMQLNSVNTEPVFAFDREGTRLCAYNSYTHRAAIAAIRPSPIYTSVGPRTPIHAALSAGALVISPDDRWTVTTAEGALQLRDARTGRGLLTFAGANTDDTLTAQFQPDGRALIVGGTVSGLRRMEIKLGTDGEPALGPEQMLDPEPGFTIEGSTGDGRLVLVSTEHETVKLLAPAHPDAAVRWPVAKVLSAAFSPDGRQVLTEAAEAVPGEKAVKVWDVNVSPPALTASFGDDPGGRVQCSRTGGWVVTTGDKTTAWWRFGSWQRGPEVPVDLQGESHHAMLSPDGATMAIEKDGKLHLLDTGTGQLLAACEGASPAGICVNEAFSADGARLTLLWQYGAVHVWDLTRMHGELTRLGLDWNASK